MIAYSLGDFIKMHFEDAGELAELLGLNRNTIYKLKAKGTIVVGNKEKFTLYPPKHLYEVDA